MLRAAGGDCTTVDDALEDLELLGDSDMVGISKRVRGVGVY